MKNVYGSRVLVTGATSGIGRACARAFAARGCDVTGVSRSAREGTEAFRGGGKLTLLPLDVTDEAAVRETVRDRGPFDIAVLCAGMGVAGPLEELPMAETRRQMEVNYFGTLQVIQALLPGMRKNGKGLILVIGSIAGRVSIPMQSQYSASKYALEAAVDALRMELAPYGVRAVILEPGDTKTGFTAARASTVAEDSVYRGTFEKSIARMARDEQNGKSPSTVAKTALALAGRKNPPARVPVGAEYKALMVLLRFLPDRVREAIVTKMYL
ncbi:MAG: SDR family NAD(P)-dependent oxidoreductase [Lachnospiraceae bacterium]|nr:SDR family NAD(P)-dependent oxidoreductase [Lachnospiraceae bacterium]